MKKWILSVISILLVVGMTCFSVFGATVYDPSQNHTGSVGRAGHYWAIGGFDKVQMPEISAPSTSPPADTGWLYVLDGGGSVQTLNFKDAAGTVTNILSAGSTKLDDVGDPDANCSITLGTYTNVFTGAAIAANQNQFLNTGNMGDFAIVYIQQLTGTPTDGKLLYGTMASDLVDGIHIYSSDTDVAATGQVLLRLDFKDDGDTDGYYIVCRDNTFTDTMFAVRMDGAVGLNQNLTFNGAAPNIITSTAGEALTINIANGDAAGEDLIITANNVSLTAVGLMTFSPDAALPIAIDASAANIATALNVGANDIVGTTGLINYTNFDVNADGDIACVDIVASGTITGATISGVTILQDAISAKSTDTTLTLNGKGTGGVSIGTVAGSGSVIIGGAGFATLVSLPAAVDLTMAGGQLSVTDTVNADLVTLTNGTMTTADGIQITLAGARTSGGAINIVDSATTAPSILITAAAATSANVISVTADALDTGTLLYLDSDAIPAATYYIKCYDGSANDLLIGANGVTVITGAAGAAALTLTLGDLVLDNGLLDIDTTTATYLSHITMTTNTDVAADAALFTLSDTDTDAANIHYLLRLRHFANGDAQDKFLVMEDNNADDRVSFEAGGTTIWSLDPVSYVQIDGTTQLTTTTSGVLDINMSTLTTNASAIDVKVINTGNAATVTGIKIDLDDDTAGTGIFYGLSVGSSDTGPAAGANLSTGIGFLTGLDVGIDADMDAAAKFLDFDAAASYTAKAFDINLAAWLGTAGAGFIDISSTSAGTAEAGQVIRINLGGTAADAAAISGKGIYIKDAAADTVGSYLLHVESDHNGSAYLDGNIGVSFATLTDKMYITANAADYAAGDSVLTIYDSAAAGQTNASYLLRLVREANADTANAFILCQDNSTGAAANGTTQFSVDYAGNVVATGTLTVNGAQIIGDGLTEVVGTINDIVDAGATNPYTVLITQSRTVFTNSQASHYDLPAAATGLEYTFVVMHASALVIDPDAADTIITGGIAGASISSSTVGDSITLIGVSAAMWAVKSVYPASTDWANE